MIAQLIAQLIVCAVSISIMALMLLLQKRRQDKELAALRARPLIEALSPEARRQYDRLPVYRDPPEANQ